MNAPGTEMLLRILKNQLIRAKNLLTTWGQEQQSDPVDNKNKESPLETLFHSTPSSLVNLLFY